MMETDHKETAPKREGALENATTMRMQRNKKNPSAESGAEENHGAAVVDAALADRDRDAVVVDRDRDAVVAAADRDRAGVDAAGVTDSHVL